MRKAIPNDYFTEDEWELLCDCCGMCCLFKIRDADTGEIFFTRIMCPFMDRETCRCRSYADRFNKMSTCVKISRRYLSKIARWLPYHCAYRCLYENRMLPEWHPLFSDNSEAAAALREKLKTFCTIPGAPAESIQTIKARVKTSIFPNPMKDFEEQLIENVIEE